MGQARYDQRVRAFVEVRGGQQDWEEAKERFLQQGWPIRGEHPSGQGPLGNAVDPSPDSRVYEIEVRLFGIAKGCDRGAADRIRKVAQAAGLEAYVLRAERLHRDRETRSRWRIIDAQARRRALDSPWRRYVANWAMARGAYDVGGLITGPARQALRLARTGNPTAGSRVAVRPLDGMWKDPVRRWPEEEGNRRALHAVVWAFMPAVALALAAHAVPASLWFWALVALTGAVRAAHAGWRLFPDGKAMGAVLVLLASGFLTAAGRGLLGSEAWTPSTMSYTVLVLGVVAGLWLLVRQWTWGEWVGWAVPLVTTLLISSFVAAGSVLHALYADGLDLSVDDLDVPPLWQFIASLKLVSMLAYVLIVPAWWGIARHRHHFYAAPGERTNVVLNALIFVALLAATAGIALDSTSQAVERTKAAAERGTKSPAYFGVEPSWTCVRTTAELGNIPGEGPALNPDRPYLLINVAGSTIVLWDPIAHEPVKLPANKAWLEPTKSGKATCA
ncbi:hypothetical protein ACF09J_22485 [Streptomyces sp. NPDC014889]|uniref:hypothetical protein n=1 Tax=Streptomyces sp. NPDC014889 TaxID=3364928 RepID=UPI0036FCC054